MSAKLVPFGKYKGQPIEAMAQDREYVEWLTAQPWFREKFQPIYNVVINNFGEPNDTPEHNALQARFTDGDFQVACACLAYGDFVAARKDLASRAAEREPKKRT